MTKIPQYEDMSVIALMVLYKEHKDKADDILTIIKRKRFASGNQKYPAGKLVWVCISMDENGRMSFAPGAVKKWITGTVKFTSIDGLVSVTIGEGKIWKSHPGNDVLRNRKIGELTVPDLP